MWAVVAMSLARAEDVTVPVPFSAPAEVPLFRGVAVVEARGSVKGPDCGAAVVAALSDAAGRGTVIRVARSTSDLAPASQTVCKQRKAGDTVSASVVDLVTIVVAPGTGRSIGADRTIQIATMLGAASGGGVASVATEELAGSAWARWPDPILAEVLDSGVLDANGRAATVYERFVPPWVSKFAPVLSAIPELSGAILEVSVTHEDPTVKKSRKTEIYRFAVPTAAASAFLKGALTDDAFLAASRVERATDVRKRDFATFRVEIGDAGLPVASVRAEDRGPIDVSEEDLEGVEDE